MISIFVNPLAGNGKSLKTAAMLGRLLTEKNISYEIFIEQWPPNIQQCTEAWIVGGDGTLNYFINQYDNIHIPLAIFKAGTGDDFAWQLYGNVSLKEQLELVLAAKAQTVDAALCNGRLFINAVGIGFDGAVLQSMGTIRRLGGHLGYLWVVIKNIFRFKELDFSIQTDKEDYNEKFLLVSIANAARTGGGFLVSPKSSIRDRKLDMMLCRPLPVGKRLRYLPMIEKGKHLDLPFIIHRTIESIRISCGKEVFAQLDGELICAKTFDIKILPGHLLFRY